MESRFTSETTRRAVIAGVMACLLALSSGLAVLRAGMTWTRADGLPAMKRQQLMIFSFDRPAAWPLTEVEGDFSPIGRGLVQEVPGRIKRKLFVFELEMPRPTPPPDAARMLQTHLDLPTSQPMGIQRYRVGAFSAVMFVHPEFVLTVMGIDGRKYLGMGVTMAGSPRSDDPATEVLDHMISSMRDERFKDLKPPLSLPGGPTVEVPGGLGTLGYAHLQELSHVVYYPSRSEGFFALHMVPVDLRFASPPPDLPSFPEGDFDWRYYMGGMRPPDPLAEVLFARFFRATGLWPGPQHVKPFRTNGKNGYVLLLSGTRASPMYEAIYGLWTGENQAAMIELLAEPESVRPALDAARAVVESLSGIANAPDPPQ